MAYTDFTLASAETELGLTVRPVNLFVGLVPLAPPAWLTDQLARGMTSAVSSEKARGEFLIAPVLLAVRELSGRPVAVLSGVRLDVDPARRLTGECDFLLTRGDPVPIVRPPLVAVVEAKRLDIEAGLGQCMAQMAAARQFNDRAGVPPEPVWGCVTTGEDWQFLRLDADGATVGLHPGRLYLSDVAGCWPPSAGRWTGRPHETPPPRRAGRPAVVAPRVPRRRRRLPRHRPPRHPAVHRAGPETRRRPPAMRRHGDHRSREPISQPAAP